MSTTTITGYSHFIEATRDRPYRSGPRPIWRIVEAHLGHCHPGQLCYIFDNGATNGPSRFHAQAHWFWGARRR